jgi:hypothetical protein
MKDSRARSAKRLESRLKASIATLELRKVTIYGQFLTKKAEALLALPLFVDL